MRCDVQRAVLVLMVAGLTPALAQQDRNVITLERTVCFGTCPAYVLRIDSSGAISFRQGTPSNRQPERTSSITDSQFDALIAGFRAIHFFDFDDVYHPTHTDGPTTYIELTLNGKTKRITHFEDRPAWLNELERTIERTANIHRWLHGDRGRLALGSPVAGPMMGGGEDLKNEQFVREDAYTRIKPGMNVMMQAAGEGKVAEVLRAVRQGEDVNAADETGWTALMIAAVAAQPEAVSALLDAGARIDQRDGHGNTALIGAAAVRFGDRPAAASVIATLLARGAAVNATNDLGESALMWAARGGMPDFIQLLLKAGANTALVNQSHHDALFYLRNAREALTFDKDLVERYRQAEAVLEH